MRFRHNTHIVGGYGYKTTDELYRATLEAHTKLVEHLLSEAMSRKREADRAAAAAFKRREYWHPFTDAQLQELFDQAKAMGDFHNAAEFAREMAYRREKA